MTIAEKIKNELVNGSDVKTISKKLKVAPSYVYTVRSGLNKNKRVTLNTPVGVQVTIDTEKQIVTIPLENFSAFIDYLKNQAA